MKLKITKSDQENARHYNSSCGCLIATMMNRLGYIGVSVGAHFVETNGNSFIIQTEVLKFYNEKLNQVKLSAIGQTIQLQEVKGLYGV